MSRKVTSKKDRIVCLVGRSGSGKTTIAEAMQRYGYSQIMSYTTRSPRGVEETGHTFVTSSAFDQLQKDLVAYTEFDGHEYGVTIQQVQNNDLYVVDPIGVQTLVASIGRENVLVVFLWAKPEILLNRMLKERGIRHSVDRLVHDEQAYKEFADYDILLVNNTQEELRRNEVILRTVLADYMMQ